MFYSGSVWYVVLLHTHIDILNLISLKNVTWHLIFRYINRWTLVRMVILTARDNCIISRDDFILHCENKYRRTEYGSLGICWQIWTRPNNYGTVYDIRCNKTFINLVRVWYDRLSPLETLCHPRASSWVTYSFSGRHSVISHSYKVDNGIIVYVI
jgi:hypothetical protein